MTDDELLRHCNSKHGLIVGTKVPLDKLPDVLRRMHNELHARRMSNHEHAA